MGMKVEETSKELFDEETAHMSHYRKMANVISHEKRYLLREDKQRLGVVLEGKNNKFFGYVMMNKMGDEKFEFCDAKATYKTYDEAEQGLITKMKE